jgi:hypothetical protein
MKCANKRLSDSLYAVEAHRDRLVREGDQILALYERSRSELVDVTAQRDSAVAAFTDLDSSYLAESNKARDAGLSFQAVRDILRDYDSAEASFGKMVEVIRIAAVVLAKDQPPAKPPPREALLKVTEELERRCTDLRAEARDCRIDGDRLEAAICDARADSYSNSLKLIRSMAGHLMEELT